MARVGTKTKWGDRVQRRADILDAARTRITNRGYLALNMRDLAAAAGVSPATLYSYFATKEELFATLYAEAIRAHTEIVRPIAAASHDLPTLLARVIDEYIELYRTFGRHFTLWSTMRHDVGDEDAPFPKELIVELREATFDNNRVLMDGIGAAAARDGRRVIDERHVPTFVWAALNGVADHLTSERRALDRFPPRRFVKFTAERLAIAITADYEAPNR